MVVDPKAIKHILHSAGYPYLKSTERVQIMRLVSGNGIITAQGLPPLDYFQLQLQNITLQARLITANGR
jgi:hypothetical protein